MRQRRLRAPTSRATARPSRRRPRRAARVAWQTSAAFRRRGGAAVARGSRRVEKATRRRRARARAHESAARHEAAPRHRQQGSQQLDARVALPAVAGAVDGCGGALQQQVQTTAYSAQSSAVAAALRTSPSTSTGGGSACSPKSRSAPRKAPAARSTPTTRAAPSAAAQSSSPPAPRHGSSTRAPSPPRRDWPQKRELGLHRRRLGAVPRPSATGQASPVIAPSARSAPGRPGRRPGRLPAAPRRSPPSAFTQTQLRAGAD